MVLLHPALSFSAEEDAVDHPPEQQLSFVTSSLDHFFRTRSMSQRAIQQNGGQKNDRNFKMILTQLVRNSPVKIIM